MKVVKNKLAPPFQEAEFEIRWGTGIDSTTDLIELGLARGVVDKSGSHLSFGGEHIGQGRERARETLLAQPQLMAQLRTAVTLALPAASTAKSVD